MHAIDATATPAGGSSRERRDVIDLVLVMQPAESATDDHLQDHLVEQIRTRIPGTAVHVTHVAPPTWSAATVTRAVAELVDAGRRVAVVPLLLSAGYYAQVEILQAVAPFQEAVVSAPLGPHPRLAWMLSDRLLRAGATARDTVILAAAASTRPCSAREVETMGTMLADQCGRPVRVANTSGRPTLEQAVTAARGDRLGTGRVVIASYALTGGTTLRRFADAGAHLITSPMGNHPALIDLVLDRYASVSDYLDGVVATAV